MSEEISDRTPATTTDFRAAVIASIPTGPMPILCDEDDVPPTIAETGRTTGRYARQCIGGLHYCC